MMKSVPTYITNTNCVIENCQAQFCRLDVTKADQWKVIYDHCESAFKAPVDLLVNNAGIAAGTDVQVIDVNLLGVVRGSTEFLNRYGTSKVNK